jgi:leader peptidase (prepilin peptidase) / N-methyltransferase
VALTEIYHWAPGYILVGALVIGLLIGSFLNVVIYRLPLMMLREWKASCEEAEQTPLPPLPTPFNLATPGSRCSACGTPIRPLQNIPVFSFLYLKGRCAACSTPISKRYPGVEALTGLLSLLVVWQLGVGAAGLFALLLLWSLIALTLIDIDHQLLPDAITLPLVWLGLLINTQAVYVPLNDAVWGAAAGYLSLWSVFWVFKWLTKKEGMGYGDFKLLAALGAWMGWQYLPLIIILSSFVGAFVGILGIIFKGNNKELRIPFGPYLAGAGLIAMLWGGPLIAYYKAFSGLTP